MKMFDRHKGFYLISFPSCYCTKKGALPRDSLELVQRKQQPKHTKKFIFTNYSYLDYETLERAVVYDAAEIHATIFVAPGINGALLKKQA
jgi:hypothetical protein